MVIDPNAETRQLHAFTLAPVADEIEEAEDGAEGLARAVARRPELIVTELRLPRIDGSELCRLLRRDHATATATIVVVTGSALPVDAARARQAGADAVLIKPVDPERVRQCTIALLVRARRARETATDLKPRLLTQVARAHRLVADTKARRQRSLSRDAQHRLTTTTPPERPPDVRCLDCDRPLDYDHTNLGGVNANHVEQWDYFKCPACGHLYQYRHRTRRLRRI